MRRTILFLITLLATVTLWPVSAWAYTGSGTADAPYLVDKWADLKTCMAAGGYIKLESDCTDPSPSNSTYLSVPSNKTVTLDLNGKTIDRGLSNQNAIIGGYVIYVQGTLTITGGGTITGGNNSSDGPGCIWQKKGNLTIQNCTISGNKGNLGGGIMVDYDSGTPTCTIKDRTVIKNNTALKGGGIYLSHYCVANIEGGSIIENTAIESSASLNKAAGGGIYVQGTLNFTGGSIKDNICSNTTTNNENGGGGIYYASYTNCAINLSGNPIVQDNKNRELADDNVKLYMPNNPMIINITGTLDPAARIGINMYEYSTSYILTNGLSGKGGSSNFTSDNPDYCIVIDSNGEVRQYTHWDKLRYNSFAQSGEVQLDRDIYAPASNASALTVNNGIEITLDLNGHKIDMAGKNIYINVRGSLTIKDSYTGTDRTHTITVDENPITITGGLITGSTYQGINNNGTLVLESGTIAGNGGGISIQAGKTATIKGGTISYNRSTTADKAGVYLVNSTSVLNVRGTPVIKNNKYVSGDTNTDKNVYLPSGSKVTITDNLEENAQMGITFLGSSGTAFTSGLNGKGTISNFVPDNASYLIRTTNEGEAMLTTAYNITVANATNGTVSTSAAIGAQGDVITVTATPDDGYYLSALTAGSEDILASKQFTIGSSNVTVTATFAPKMEITPTVSLDNWVYGNSASVPTVGGNTGNGDVSYLYKVKDADDDTYTETVPTAVGTYTVKATIAESAQYLGNTATADFTITPKSIAGVSIVAIEDQTYTGSAITPTTVITDTEISPTPTLTENTDYTLSYSTNNTNVTGENVTITVTGKGNYDSSTSTSTTFKIVSKALDATMIADIADQPYTGSTVEPEFTVTYNGMNLSKGTHYTAAFDNNTNTTDAPSVTITAADANYSGTASANFSIVAANLNTATVTGSSKTVDYDGRTSPAIDPLSVNFPVEDYKIEYRKTYQTGADVATIPTNAIGEFTVVLKPTDTGNLTGEKVTDYKVNVQLPINLKQCEWVTYFDERFDLATPTGYQAYKVSNASTTSVTAEAIDYIPKNVPVILKTTATGTSSSSMTVRFNEQQTTSDITGNASFIGIPSTSEGVTPSGTSFILVSDKFVLYEGTDAIPAHRCYLTFGVAGTRSIGIGFGDGGATGISDPPNDPAFEEQGQWYDLQGRRIEKPTKKGLYIKDGQKVVITGKEARL